MKVAVFRALQLGDMLCAVPALSALRAALPGAHVTLIGLPWAHAFAARYRMLVDELIPFPGAPGFPEQPEDGEGLPAFFARARAGAFDLAIQLHGSGGPANDILFALGARSHAGFVQPGEAREGCFMPWPERGLEPERCLTLLRYMRLADAAPPLWFSLAREDLAECAQLLSRLGVRPGNCVLVHPGAQLPSRRWPLERFAAVADALAKLGLDVLLTGTSAERALTEGLSRAMRQKAIDLSGQTSLGGLAALVAQVPLVVCNDTGLSHLAAALGTRSVVIASGSDTRRWAPADRERHRVIADYPACRPCAYRTCPFGHECARAISVEQVLATAHHQLARHAA